MAGLIERHGSRLHRRAPRPPRRCPESTPRPSSNTSTGPASRSASATATSRPTPPRP
ncbi:MAG: hypothetical protein MZW92_03295 [Comamonadaceae bacterium]|nr:hypothetical protein [Comamonadaceae bacterium]